MPPACPRRQAATWNFSETLMPVPSSPIRVVIVDDSAVMRGMLKAMLASDPALQVAGEAACPHEAREVIRAVSPQVITLEP